MTAHQLLRRAVGTVVAAVPMPVARRILRLWLVGVAERGDPKHSMRDLIEVLDDVYARVDRAAIDYDDGIHAKHRLMRYHDFFVERIGPGEHVLDIGCGKGEMAYDVVTRAGAKVVGVDLNHQYLAFARSRFQHEDLTFVEGDALVYVPAERFGVVILSNVLEHIEHRVEFLQRLVNVVQPERVLLRVPVWNRDWVVPLRKEVGLFPFSDPTHFIEYEPETFEAELLAAGLEVTHLQVNWGEIWAEARPRQDDSGRS
jgi:ubiquinone/menaquinone biosynthesis C-methylase UbiE